MTDRKVTLDELLAELTSATTIVLTIVLTAQHPGGGLQQRRASFEAAAEVLRTVAQRYPDEEPGFDPPHWEGRTAYLGPLLGGFPA